MNLHELVDEYIRTAQTLKSFVGHFQNCNNVKNKKPLENYGELIEKLMILLSQIMVQSKKENYFVAIYELKRMGDPKLGEKSVVDVIIEEFSHE